MGRPRRIIVPLDAVATDTRTEALASPLAAVEPEPAPEPSQRTPARQRLADAIEYVRQLEVEIREAGAAVSEAEKGRLPAFYALEKAKDMLLRSRPKDAGSYTPGPLPAGAFWGGTYDTKEAANRADALAAAPLMSIADAKAALVVAQDAYDSVVRLEQHHKDRLTRVSGLLQSARYGITSAVRLVVRDDPALLALAAESARLATRAEAARMAFQTATGNDTMQPGSPFYRAGKVADARTSPEAMADWSVSRAWSEALESLSSDPDAPLPVSV